MGAQKSDPKTTPEAADAEAPQADAPTPEQQNAADPDVATPEPELVVPEPELSEEEKLRAQVAELQSRLRQVSKAYKDREGEMEDFRKRQAGQAAVTAERKVFTVVAAFFDPIQNLKRSIDVGGDDPQSILDGVQMVHHQFVTAMQNLGLQEVPGVGAPFDPEAHEALAVMPTAEPEQDGIVLVVHTTGYSLRGKTLKPAQVVIGKYTEPAEA